MSKDKNDKSESTMTATEVAKGLIDMAKKSIQEKLNKSEETAKSGMSVKQAAKEIKGDKKLNEVLPKVSPDKRDDVLKELRMTKADPRNQNSAQMAEINVPQPKAPAAQPKAIAKQPLQLKKFMDNSAMKKSKGVHNPFASKDKSIMGHANRGHWSYGNENSNKNKAKQEAGKVLKEIQNQPKPKLPK